MALFPLTYPTTLKTASLGGSSTIVMDDCRKSQTLDSLPAKGGGLPIVIIVE